jgi:hypothetical protein
VSVSSSGSDILPKFTSSAIPVTWPIPAPRSVCHSHRRRCLISVQPRRNLGSWPQPTLGHRPRHHFIQRPTRILHSPQDNVHADAADRRDASTSVIVAPPCGLLPLLGNQLLGLIAVVRLTVVADRDGDAGGDLVVDDDAQGRAPLPPPSALRSAWPTSPQPRSAPTTFQVIQAYVQGSSMRPPLTGDLCRSPSCAAWPKCPN